MARTTIRSARTRDDDDYKDKPHSSRRDADDERDSARRTVSRRRSDDDNERGSRQTTTRSHPRDEDSDGDRESRRASREAGSDARSTTIGRGREGLRRHRETHKSGNYPDKLAVDKDEEVLIRFVDDDFIVTYYEHNLYDDFKGQKRQFSFVCLGEDCPLCAIGDDPKFYALINVIDLRNPRKPELKLWYATPNPGELIEDEMDSLEERDKKINDPSLYYVVSKKKQKNNFFAYSMKGVKARDLEEDGYGEPLTDDEIAEFSENAWTEDVVRLNTRRDLQEIADELAE